MLCSDAVGATTGRACETEATSTRAKSPVVTLDPLKAGYLQGRVSATSSNVKVIQ